jgi:hypothetical protein
MVVTEAGIVKDAKLLQEYKALSPMVTTDEGMLTDGNLLQL